MGTVTNINGGDGTGTTILDEGKKCELTIRMVAMLMSMAEGKGRGLTEVREAQAYSVCTYKSHFATIKEAMEMGQVLDDDFIRMCALCEDLQ